MEFKRRALASIALAGVILASSSSTAFAIPAFARKYGTSCQTCHVVYPKLTPFGEAFRHNGYLFPGVDSDYTKEKPVELGQDEYKKLFPDSVWPGSLPGSVPIAVGFNGAAVAHPDKKSGGAKADNNVQFSTQALVEEGHIWLGGSYDDNITYFGEYTLADGGSEIEHAQVLFNNLFGPKHAINLHVGRGAATLSSFGAHSTYLADAVMPMVPVTALFGGTTDSFSAGNHNNGAELSGVVGGRLNYSIGINGGSNNGPRPTEDSYAHIGYKIGGMRLDGEAESAGHDHSEDHEQAGAMKPWAETSLTFDVFAYHSNSLYTTATPADLQDVATTIGGSIRGQLGSFEINAGAYQETHNHALADASKATATVQYNEISYIVFPWLVPAVRVEYLSLKPENSSAVTDLRIFPGVAILVRPNLKLVLVGQLESAKGAPDAGWSPAGGFATPDTATATVDTEVEAITATLSTSF